MTRQGLTVLVVGSGGREHALAWALRRSSSVDRVLVAPGNAGTATIAENLPIPSTDIAALLAAAQEYRVDLTVVGPEEPLARGLADAFQRAGLLVFGPTAAAAQIEASKAWAKDVMEAAGVPTARARIVSDLEDAQGVLDHARFPLVIKASGLAAGKGAVIVHDRTEAEAVLHWMLVERGLGTAADQVLLEEYLVGREVSFLVITDGTTVVPLPPARDYKRLGDGDAGPNTGGMGAYAPVPEVTPELQQQIMQRIIDPTLAELRRRNIVYRGVLYAGLMLTAHGPAVLEFNCRFGDPETQAILPLIDSDVGLLFLAAARGQLHTVAPPLWRDLVSVTVVLASGGYPGRYSTGYAIEGLEAVPDDVLVFHAGTRREGERVVTAGGRVLNVTAVAPRFAEARERVYAAIQRIHFPGMTYRRDIAVAAVDHPVMPTPRADSAE
ncbi:MAG: phosphoribosylamine--glycine ligase [Thermomicrobium sp.]|nr:phosphoribosylamine--glycine ligase [Thermomicrobium sp.]